MPGGLESYRWRRVRYDLETEQALAPIFFSKMSSPNKWKGKENKGKRYVLLKGLNKREYIQRQKPLEVY